MAENDFLTNKYKIVRNVINKEFLEYLNLYFIFNEIKNPGRVDNQVPTAYSTYADPMTESILSNLKNKIEEETELELWPAYSFYRIYRTGDVLHPHKDRPSCEISATLCLYHSYSNNFSWPIFVDGKQINLNIGDMLIYKGIEVTHWRNKFIPPSNTDYHIQTFLHYVQKNGEHREWKYDKRTALGR
jgi:hypothetical protein